MSLVTKTPPITETVGAQYICFDTMTEDNQWTNQFASEVEKTEVVKTVKVAEQIQTSEVRASGKVYDSGTMVTGADIEIEVIAFPADTQAKMRGDHVGAGGLILAGGAGVGRERPFFAYGKTVILKNGNKRMDWYPKCKLTENSDEAKASETSFSEQTGNLKVHAYPFNDAGDLKASVDTTLASYPKGLTEDKFFAKPILTDEDLASAAAVL